MPDQLDFSLPGGDAPHRRATLLPILTLLVALTILGILLLHGGTSSETGGGMEAEAATRLKELAMNLERRQVYTAAAEVWKEYLETAALTPEDQAEVVFLRGTCLKRGGGYAEAVRCLTEVEKLPLSRERKRKAQQMLLDCLSSLGLHDSREMVLKQFATGAPTQEGTVLARVDGEEITKEQLRQYIESDARKILAMQGAPLTPRELAKSAAGYAEAQLKSKEGLQAALTQVISSRLLYREGLERGYGEDAETLHELSRTREQLVGQRVVEADVAKALENLGPTEISNHYLAHKEEFVEKAGSEFSWGDFPTEARALEAIAKLGDPATAPEVSLKKASGPAVEGQSLPDVPSSAEVAAHLLALGEGEHSDRPIEIGGFYYIFRVDKKRPERQLSLSEAEPQVRAALAQVKRGEAQEALGEMLQTKYEVKIVPGALAEEPPSEQPPEETKAPDDAVDANPAAPGGSAPTGGADDQQP